MKPKFIVDVRSPQEFSRTHVEGAVNIPLEGIEQNIGVLPGLEKGSDIVLYCLSGARSAMAVSVLKQLGYTGAVNGGGISTMALNHPTASAS